MGEGLVEQGASANLKGWAPLARALTPEECAARVAGAKLLPRSRVNVVYGVPVTPLQFGADHDSTGGVAASLPAPNGSAERLARGC